MLSKTMFSNEYVQELHEKTQGDPLLIERMIYAFGLLEAIQLSGLPFCFKGGTSLLLLLDTPRRFSTDIDIIVTPGTDIDGYIAKAGSFFPFIRVEEDFRKLQAGINKRHFRFTYHSPTGNHDVHILLDVLFEDIPYAKTIALPIRNNLIVVEGPDTTVTTPTINGLLADKLTAFAPHTTGIPFGIGKELEIIKQLYDCGTLFELMDNYDEVCSTYQRTAAMEIRYMKLVISPDSVLRDTVDACLCIASRGKHHKDDYMYFKDGISRIRNHIISDRFTGESAGHMPARSYTWHHVCLRKWIVHIHQTNKASQITRYTGQRLFHTYAS